MFVCGVPFPRSSGVRPPCPNVQRYCYSTVWAADRTAFGGEKASRFMDADNGSKTESLHYIIMINVVFPGSVFPPFPN